MKFMFRTLALTRYLGLRRQLKDIERAILDLPLEQRRELVTLSERELTNAASAPAPHLYGSDRIHSSTAWGDGSEIAFERARTDNLTLKLRGIATWLAIVYYETRENDRGEMQDLHKQVMRAIRLLRESTGQARKVEAMPLSARVA